MTDIVRTVTFRAPIGRVWVYLTQRDKIAQWLMPNSFAAKVGHRFTMDCPPGIGSGEPVACEVVTLEPPKDGRAVLVYHWVIPDPHTRTTLTLELQEDAGATTLHLTHAGWLSDSADGRALRSRHAEGWTLLLSQRLAPLVEAAAS